MEDLRHGFKHLRPSYIEKGLRELGDALEDLTDAMIACGGEELATDLAAIAQELKQGSILKVVVHEGMKIFHHLKDVQDDVHNMQKAWHAGDYFGSGESFGKLLSILLEQD